MPHSIMPKIKVFIRTADGRDNSFGNNIIKSRESKTYNPAMALAIPILSLVTMSCITHSLEEKINLQLRLEEIFETE